MRMVITLRIFFPGYTLRLSLVIKAILFCRLATLLAMMIGVSVMFVKMSLPVFVLWRGNHCLSWLQPLTMFGDGIFRFLSVQNSYVIPIGNGLSKVTDSAAMADKFIKPIDPFLQASILYRSFTMYKNLFAYCLSVARLPWVPPSRILAWHHYTVFAVTTVAGDGVAGIKRRRRDVSSNGVRNFATASGRGRLKEDLESSMVATASGFLSDVVASISL
ncbi:hypothetical protein Tco_0468996 [Tanacetum coccineum]